MIYSILLYNPVINEFSIIEMMETFYFQTYFNDFEASEPWVMIGEL